MNILSAVFAFEDNVCSFLSQSMVGFVGDGLVRVGVFFVSVFDEYANTPSSRVTENGKQRT